MRHTIKIAVMIVAVVAAAMSGLAFAQTTDDSDPTTTYQSRVLEQLAPLVDEGVISQEQADAVAESFTERFSDRLAQRQERVAERQAFHEELLALLDVTSDELRAAIQDGMTLAEVAEQQDVAVQDVIDLMVAQAEERLAGAVEDGRLTADEAEEKLADITANITDKVNNGGGFGHHRGHRGPGGPGGRGFGPGFGPGPAGADAPATDAVNA
jgi:polyhydroxyalkanoate synthesis regulator phasin